MHVWIFELKVSELHLTTPLVGGHFRGEKKITDQEKYLVKYTWLTSSLSLLVSWSFSFSTCLLYWENENENDTRAPFGLDSRSHKGEFSKSFYFSLLDTRVPSSESDVIYLWLHTHSIHIAIKWMNNKSPRVLPVTSAQWTSHICHSFTQSGKLVFS